MNTTRRDFIGISAAATALLSACSANNAQDTDTQDSAQATATQANASNLTLDSAAWRYDTDSDTYYQLGITYCESPADADYEQLAILVPGAYFKATDNGDGTFTCEVNPSAEIGAYTAATAPIVMPINTPGYSTQSPMSEYSAQTSYAGAGIVYVHAGCRGRDEGAPAGVVDLKAAVRFLRLVKDQIAGDTERIFTFGMSGGGAQSAIMGATGDSDLYEPYLAAIGAAGGVSDAVFGSMDWCPITGLDVADEAYEWMMGCTRSNLSEEEQGISDALAEAYATWVNGAGICDENGAALSLVESDEGIYQAGSYYERVREAIEESLNDFLADTAFPYDASSSGGMGGMRGGRPDGGAPEFDGNRPDDSMREGFDSEGGAEGNGNSNTADDMANAEQNDDITRTQTDSLGTDVATRVAMYTPLHYLLASEEGYGLSEPARHWRIRTGINQGDTALTTELNLALALKADPRVASVDFATIWGQGHTMAESTGSAEENFITWVESCLT